MTLRSRAGQRVPAFGSGADARGLLFNVAQAIDKIGKLKTSVASQ